MLKRPSVVLFAGWLCALTLLTASTSSAQASCGDWLAHIGDRSAASKDFSTSRPSGTPTELISGREGRDSQPAPCHGPHCGQAPEQPLPLLPSNVSLRSEQLVLTATTDFGPPKTWQFDTLRESHVHSAKGFFPCPDHPPRVS